MRKNGPLGTILLTAALAWATGCGADKKPDDSGPPADPKPKEKGPAGEPEKKAQPAEVKFKLASAEFIKEYAANPRKADLKYNGTVVELTGNVTRSAGVELDGFSKPVGSKGTYKASLLMGGSEANRADTVVVRGLKPAAVGQVLRGQEARVKGRVARHQPPNPVELLDAELLSVGADTSISLNESGWEKPATREKLFDVSATVTGAVVGRGTDGGDYLLVTGTNVTNLRCYLLNGVSVLFPSGFPNGQKVRLAGTLHDEVVDKDNPTAAPGPVLRDCIPLDRDPKAK